MSNRVTSIILKDNQLGNKIKATVKEEREIYAEGKKSPLSYFYSLLCSSCLTLESSFQIYETPYVLKVVKKLSCVKLHLFLVPNEIILGQQAAPLKLQIFANELLTLD